jgi:excinuclease ABC subunit C
VLAALGVEIPVLGMVKDDFHKTKDLIDGVTPLGLQENKEAYHFVYEIQEEVHRFAIEYHKKLRNKEMTHSVLEEIPGIGKKRARQLIMHFKSIDRIKAATLEELASVEGMTAPAGQAVLDFFEGSERKESNL